MLYFVTEMLKPEVQQNNNSLFSHVSTVLLVVPGLVGGSQGDHQGRNRSNKANSRSRPRRGFGRSHMTSTERQTQTATFTQTSSCTKETPADTEKQRGERGARQQEVYISEVDREHLDYRSASGNG